MLSHELGSIRKLVAVAGAKLVRVFNHSQDVGDSSLSSGRLFNRSITPKARFIRKVGLRADFVHISAASFTNALAARRDTSSSFAGLGNHDSAR
jgi:hypothetical protein